MRNLKEFNINFVGLKEGNHEFEYQIDKKFFDLFQYDDFNNTNVIANINLEKKNTLLELYFKATGSVNVFCDLTAEPFDQEIDGVLKLIVKFGPEYNDDNEEVLIIPHEEYQINVAQYIYELIILSVPHKRVHPNVLDGTMQSDILKKLKELEVKEEKTVEENTTTDPRWDKLKDLLTGKNT